MSKEKIARQGFKMIFALLLVVLALFSVSTLNAIASNVVDEPIIAIIADNEVEIPPDGVVSIEIDGQLIEMEIPLYLFLDGEFVRIDDERFGSITPALAMDGIPTIRGASTGEAPLPRVPFIIPFSIPANITVTNPANPGDVEFAAGRLWLTTAQGRMEVSARRYYVVINGMIYEAYCANPNLPGPGSAGAAYILTNNLAEQFRTVLRYGHPHNPHQPQFSPDGARWFLYMTRVAIGLIGNPGAVVDYADGSALSSANQLALDQLMSGTFGSAPASLANNPPITINGPSQTSDHQVGATPQSPTFDIGHNRRSQCGRNLFHFVWDAATPVGTRLYANGIHIATAPVNPHQDPAWDNDFSRNGAFRNGSFDDSWLRVENIHFVMPAGSEGQTAAVDMVGVNNQYANRVFVMRNANNPDLWQDIVFYIHEYEARASYTWDNETDVRGRLRIIKTDMTGNNLGGAVFTINGPDSSMPMTVTVSASGWTSGPLVPGTYTITEITPPTGFTLASNPTQTVTVTENHTATAPAITTFSNQPYTNGNGNGDYSCIIIYKREMSNGVGNNQLLAGAHFRIQGYYPGNPAIPIDRVGVSDASGRVVFCNLPAGHFTITEIAPPSGYLLGDNNVWTVNLEWGQRCSNCSGGSPATAPSHTFFNAPKSSLEILKIDGITNEPLAGAIFELYDPTTGERWQATSGANGIAVIGRGSYGNFLYPGRTYILREIVAPEGYVLTDGPREIVLSPGDENRVTWRNWRNPGLTIIKVCQDTNERLAGAHFTVVAQGSGRPLPTDFPLITNDNGEIIIPWTLFEGENERSFIVTETVPPPGFHLSDPNWQLVTLQAGHDNTVVFANRRMSTLTIYKTDAITGAAIQGAEFTIERISPAPVGMLTGNPFRTNAQGQIVLPDLPAGVYRIIETRAANGYWLDTDIANRTWTITIRENEDYLLQVENTMLPTLIITKMNQVTFHPVPLTRFLVEFEVPGTGNVIRIGEFVTDANGQIILPFVQPGWYRITETHPAPGMSLNVNNSYRIFLNPGQNTYQLLAQMPGLTPNNAIENQGQEPAQVTPQTPVNTTPELPPNWSNMPDDARTAAATANLQVTGGDAHLTSENIWNWPLNSIVIKKTCSVTGQLLQGATFEVIHTSAGVSGTMGTVIGRFTTDHSGAIVLTGLIPGSYVVREVIPPNNFTLSVTNTQTVHLMPDGHSVVEVVFDNDPYGSLVISKRCSVTGVPLHNAEFRVVNSSGAVVGTANGLFRTNAQGEILIPNLPPGSYVITEVSAPSGFILDSTPQTIRVNATGQIYRLEFTNRPVGGLTLEKVDDNGRPLAGAEFELRRPDGSLVGRQTTNNSGVAIFPGLAPGVYVITEVRAPAGYMIIEGPRTIELRAGENRIERFVNPKLPSIVIRKICGDTGRPLPGVVFEFARYFGNGNTGQRLKNYAVDNSYEFVTDASGHIYLPTLEHGTWIAIETRPLPGYAPAAPRTFTVGQNGDTTIIIRNYRFAELSILKVNALTRAPLAGVHFEISRPDGTRLINPATGFHTFITDSRGMIHLPSVPDGRYYLHETRALPGFIVDHDIIAFNIDASTRQREHVLVVENSPASGLRIIKTCAQTRQPLQGVEFEVRHADGRLVTGLILDGNQPNTPHNSPQLSVSGLFVTDHRGHINLNHLQPGVYHVRETRALDGYELDTTVHVITILPGQQTVLEVTNRPLSGLRLLKVCAWTQAPLFNVEFMVFDSRNQVVGVFYTDNNGLIDFGALLVEGRYTIRETRPAPGFFRDDMPRTIELVAGQVTEIVWENVPYAGQIQIRKVSADFNEINGLPAGTPLEGAIFEILDWRTGNIVDRIISGRDGMAVSRPLPLGRYRVREVQAPAFYMLNTTELDVTIEFATQIIRLEVANASANVGVSVRKSGPAEVLPGQNLVVYEVSRIRNESTIPLADFFFRDTLPIDAFRITSIQTGTFNQSLRYRIEATTNTGRTIIVNDNLQTTRNHTIDMRPAALGLASNEFVVEFMFIFGQVPAGFSQVTNMRIDGRILNQNFPNGFEFANRVEVGGRTGGEWIITGDTVVTRIRTQNRTTIPRTGN